MGVIDRSKGLERKNGLEPSQPPASDDELSIPETVSSRASTIVAQPVSRPKNGNKAILVLTHPGKHCGKRRLRHYRDVEDLMRWNDNKNEYEITIHDFMNNKPSPFAILLQDDNLLQAWWEFINKTNQNYFMQRTGSVLSVQAANEENTASTSPQKRLPMPSEYKRIERHLKELLQRKSTSPEMVREIEELLIQFFVETPKETLRIKKLTKYESLINQAVCQYHGLQADVDEACDRKRKDLIVALETEFYTQPTTALSAYIEQRQKFFL